MRIAAGVLLILVSIVNLVGGLGHTVGSGAKAVESRMERDLSVYSRKLARDAEDSAAAARDRAAFAIFLWVMVGLQIAGAVTLFTNKAKAFCLAVAGLTVLTEVFSILITEFGITNVPGLVAGTLALVAGGGVRAGPADAPDAASRDRRAWMYALAIVAIVAISGVAYHRLGRTHTGPTVASAPGRRQPAPEQVPTSESVSAGAGVPNGAGASREPIIAAFRDTFDRADLGADYQAMSPRYSIRNGRLAADATQDAPIFLLRPIPRDVVIELDAGTDTPQGELKVELFTAGPSLPRNGTSGYELIFGGWNNTQSIIARLGEREQTAKKRKGPVIKAGKTYHWKIVRTGSRLDWFVDDMSKPFLSFDDNEPLVPPDHAFFAFNSWQWESWFDNLAITPLGATAVAHAAGQADAPPVAAAASPPAPAATDPCQARLILDPDPKERGANLRDAPNGSVLLEIPNCTEVCVLEEQGAWAHVRASPRDIGYVHTTRLASTNAPRCQPGNSSATTPRPTVKTKTPKPGPEPQEGTATGEVQDPFE
jgi:hypothetical protein